MFSLFLEWIYDFGFEDEIGYAFSLESDGPPVGFFLLPLAAVGSVAALLGRGVVVRRIAAGIVLVIAGLFLRFELVGPGVAAAGALLMFLGGRGSLALQPQAPVAPPKAYPATGTPSFPAAAPPPPPAAGFPSPPALGSPDPRFAEVAGRYAQHKQQVSAGQLTPDQLDQLLMSLVFEYQGRYWMIGANTGQWYASEGGDWVPATPPGSA